MRQKLQHEGCTCIDDIKKSGEKYQAKATKAGKQVTLDIDARTGHVSSQSD